MTTDTQLAPEAGTEFDAARAERFRHLFVPNVAYKLFLAIENDDNAPAVILVHAALSTTIVVEGDEGAARVQRLGIEHAFLNLSADIKERQEDQHCDDHSYR